MNARGRSGNCPRCGLERGGAVEYCPACGYEFPPSQGKGDPKPLNRAVPVRTARFDLDTHSRHAARTLDAPAVPAPQVDGGPASQFVARLLAPFRLTTIQGTVIHLDPPYQARVEKGIIASAFKIFLGILFLPLTMIGYAAFTAVSWMIPGSPHRRGPGFLEHFLSYFMLHRMFKPPEMETVRDFRLRIDGGRERLVRIRGDFVAGNVNPGDEVVVEGPDRAGTIVFRRGMNLRTQSQILVRRP